MTLKSRIVGMIVVVFALVFVGSYIVFGWFEHHILAGIGTVYAEKQALYNRERILHPLMRELALARKLADSAKLKAWARDEGDPALRTAALRELEEYRRFFTDGSFFFVVHTSGNYYFDDQAQRYLGQELRYTLDPNDPENRWYYGTVESGDAYRLNVDFDEKLGVTKVWINVVVRDGNRPLGIVGTGIDLTQFIAAVVSSERDGVSNLFVEETGAIQAYDRLEWIDFRTISKAPSQRKTIYQLMDKTVDRERLRTAMDALRGRPAGAVEVLMADPGGHRVLIGLTHLSEIGWYAVTLVDAEKIVGGRAFLSLGLLLFAALVVLAVSVAVVLNRVVLDRIVRLDLFVRQYAPGASVEPPGGDRRDEIGRLESGFRRMAATVQEHTGLLENEVLSRTAELADKNQKLEQALAEVQTLSGLLPTCMYCKKIRDQEGDWKPMEAYISQRTEAQFSHGVCPDCLEQACRDMGRPTPPHPPPPLGDHKEEQENKEK